MIFQHSRGGVIKLGADALASMIAYAQHRRRDLEAGGLLLGRYIRGGYDITVDRVTVPQSGDKRSRFGFYRAAETHGRLVTEAWESSNGTCNCVGDWHTHAEPRPTPSHIDIDNWQRMLREDIREDEACFFVIVGTEEIRVWEGNHRTGAIVEAIPRVRNAA